MRVDLFDATPAMAGEKHGPEGPCHAASAHVDYAYQVEQLVLDTAADEPTIVLIRCRELVRQWRRDGASFVEVPWTS